jgi:hypothetical protein
MEERMKERKRNEIRKRRIQPHDSYITNYSLFLEMFDKVLFLGQGGRTVYSGPVDEAETYFAKIGYPLPPYVNPADFYMDVISGSVQNERNVYTCLFEEWEKHQMMVEEVGSEVEEPKEVGAKEEGGDETQSIQSNGSRSTIEIDRPSSQILINVKEAVRISKSSQGMYYLYITNVCSNYILTWVLIKKLTSILVRLFPLS